MENVITHFFNKHNKEVLITQENINDAVKAIKKGCKIEVKDKNEILKKITPKLINPTYQTTQANVLNTKDNTNVKIQIEKLNQNIFKTPENIIDRKQSIIKNNLPNK